MICAMRKAVRGSRETYLSIGIIYKNKGKNVLGEMKKFDFKWREKWCLRQMEPLIGANERKTAD